MFQEMETGVAVIEVEVTGAGIVIEALVTGIGDSILWLFASSLRAPVTLFSANHFFVKSHHHHHGCTSTCEITYTKAE